MRLFILTPNIMAVNSNYFLLIPTNNGNNNGNQHSSNV